MMKLPMQKNSLSKSKKDPQIMTRPKQAHFVALTMKYKDKGNVRVLIMGISHIGSKLKVLKLEFSDGMLVHLVLLQLPTRYN